jgi:MYXO-CTERM domain-containing protein
LTGGYREILGGCRAAPGAPAAPAASLLLLLLALVVAGRPRRR